MATNTPEGTHDSQKDTGCLAVSTETNQAKGHQVPDRQNSQNRIAERLNLCGWITVAIVGWFVVVLWVVCIIGAVIGVVKGVVGAKLILAGLCVGNLLTGFVAFFAFALKTLFDGFAELIQIAHDIRKDA